MSGRSSLDTAIWYAKRPGMWGEFARSVRQRFGPRRPDERTPATDRCRAAAVPREQAFEALGAAVVDLADLPRYAEARRRLADKGIGVAGAADTALLYAVCAARRPEAVLETGVAHGMSSLAVLLAMDAAGTGRLVSVDMPYRGSDDDSYVGQAVPEDLRSRWTLIRQPDRRGLPRALSFISQYDIVHYDSDKTRQGREFAFPLLWDATRPGGLFLSDDANDNLVFLEFADRVGVEPIIWKKPGDDSTFVGALLHP